MYNFILDNIQFQGDLKLYIISRYLYFCFPNRGLNF